MKIFGYEIRRAPVPMYRQKYRLAVHVLGEEYRIYIDRESSIRRKKVDEGWFPNARILARDEARRIASQGCWHYHSRIPSHRILKVEVVSSDQTEFDQYR